MTVVSRELFQDFADSVSAQLDPQLDARLEARYAAMQDDLERGRLDDMKKTVKGIGKVAATSVFSGLALFAAVNGARVANEHMDFSVNIGGKEHAEETNQIPAPIPVPDDNNEIVITSVPLPKPTHGPEEAGRGRAEDASIAGGLNETMQEQPPRAIDAVDFGFNGRTPLYETGATDNPEQEAIAQLYNLFAVTKSGSESVQAFATPEATATMANLIANYPEYTMFEFGFAPTDDDSPRADRTGDIIHAQNIIVYGVPEQQQATDGLQMLRAPDRPPALPELTRIDIAINVAPGAAQVSPFSSETTPVETATTFTYLHSRG